MNELIVKNDVSSMILEVRDNYVIMDRDVAKLFCMETRIINQNVKRNINHFNEENYFQVTKEEFDILKSQNDILKSQFVISKGGIRKLPYVFTKDGIIVLASILRIENDLILEIINAFDRLKNESNSVINGDENIVDCIYEIRGKRVILDFDLARFYECENGTKSINLAVKRNIEKFPENYMFTLTEEESKDILRFQIETSKLTDGRGGRRYLPYAFTEEGVLMLATILHTTVAVEMSIKIIDAFVAMKKYINYVSLEQTKINNMVLKHDGDISNNSKSIEKLEKAFDSFKKEENKTTIYFSGQIYDAYSKILSILKQAKKSLIIIDSYADNILLDIISKLNIDVILITTNKHLSNLDIQMYNSQYNNLKVVYDNSFHDRFFIVDKIVYHCGASVNRIGYKTFAINKMSEKVSIKALIDKVNTII